MILVVKFPHFTKIMVITVQGGNHDSLLSRDHSFFGSEWQKRWCVLNNVIFYYFGSDKGAYQAGHTLKKSGFVNEI